MSEQVSQELRELRRRVGDVSQLVSTRAARLADGNEDGTRIIDARAAERFRGERPVYGLRGIGHRAEGNLGRWRSMTELAEDLVDDALEVDDDDALEMDDDDADGAESSDDDTEGDDEAFDELEAEELEMLTEDENIVEVQMSVQYVIDGIRAVVAGG